MYIDGVCVCWMWPLCMRHDVLTFQVAPAFDAVWQRFLEADDEDRDSIFKFIPNVVSGGKNTKESRKCVERGVSRDKLQ